MKRGVARRCLRSVLLSLLTMALLITPTIVSAADSGSNNAGSQHRLIDHQRVQNLKERINDLRERAQEHHQNHHTGSGGVNGAMEALQTKVRDLEASMAALQAKMVALETKAPGTGGASSGVPNLEKYVTIDPNPINGVKGPHLIFTGVNVHVRSGGKATDDGGTPQQGLGNLILGYNEADPSVVLLRTGSHNLVAGQSNGFSSFGGAVFGSKNQTSGLYATILGGDSNVASGVTSSILGGSQGSATGAYSTVLGGTLEAATIRGEIRPTQ